MLRGSNRRIRLLLLVFTVVFALTLGRAMWLQAVRAQSLGKLASGQHRESVTIPARRGTIFDRTGVQLAIGEQATTVYADPRQITQPQVVAVAAGRALHLDPNEVYRRITDRSKGFVYIARQADPELAAKLERRKLDGVGFYREERRTYPQGPVGASLLGYAGVDNRGLSGLELELDRKLAGRPGRQTVVKDPFGRAIDIVSTTPERDGKDVRLTIDHTIQANAEAELRKAVARWGAKRATAIVMDPRTGAFLAMGNAPGFDANRYPKAGEERQRNRAVTDTYEPGSTFKLVTVAGALSDGLVTPSTTFTLPYQIQVADRWIHDAEPRGTVNYSVAQILSHSSNVGAITLAESLSRQARGVSYWISRFGFGRKTGIDYPGESAGIVIPPEQWSGSTIGNVPIGHGIAVTPVQMASAYAAIANHGLWVRPHLVARVGNGARARPKRRRIVSKRIAGELTQMLRDVVIEGTGTLAEVPGYRVAGKTGTAAKPNPWGGYSDSRYIASFVGFVPAGKPRLVILVTVDEPHGAIFGGMVAAPVFQEIAKFDLQYLEVPPDAPATVNAQ
jgi:cell division protein FtsI (penicillin-binding protein 3)